MKKYTAFFLLLKGSERKSSAPSSKTGMQQKTSLFVFAEYCTAQYFCVWGSHIWDGNRNISDPWLIHFLKFPKNFPPKPSAYLGFYSSFRFYFEVQALTPPHSLTLVILFNCSSLRACQNLHSQYNKHIFSDVLWVKPKANFFNGLGEAVLFVE